LVGVSRRGTWPERWQSLAGRVTLRACDLCDPAAAEAMLRDVQPDQIYHLAGYAHVGRSFHEPEEAWSGNLTATRCLLEGVARWGGRPRVLYVGSGQVYGDADTPEGTHDEAICCCRPALMPRARPLPTSPPTSTVAVSASRWVRAAVQPHRPRSVA
jgi:nucleoside-diphosphate-sugar epimerase